MNNNSLILIVISLSIAILGTYYYKEKIVEHKPQEQWNDWDQPKNQWNNWGPSDPKPSQPVRPETEPSAQPRSYQEAVSMARKTSQKMLLIFGAKWCHYCEQMKSTTLQSSSVKRKLQNYVYYYVDTDVEPSIARKYNSKSIPYYVIATSDERIIKSGSGYKSEKEFIKWIDK